MAELKYWIWLSELFSKGSDKPDALLDYFETPERIFAASAEELAVSGLVNQAETARIMRHSLERSEFILKECGRLKIRVVSLEDPLYPDRLKNIYAAPPVLYVYGDLSGMDDNVVLGVVGTRHPTEYGKTVTDELCYQLAAAGAVIVSGCAVGIDAHAHMGALKAGGRTVGVLGCGLDVDYPAENKGLKRGILKYGGALISELPPGTTVSRKYFPTRNRLISGLSLGVVVTEAPVRSGSLITLNLALEQGRDVFCVPPHDICNPLYQGVVKPLRDGATAVYDINDILFEYYGEYSHKLVADKAVIRYVRQLNGDGSQRRVADGTAEAATDPSKEAPRPEPALSGNAKIIYEALDAEPLYVSELAEKTGLGLPDLLAALTEMEIDGLAVSFSGQRYARAK